MAPCKDIIRHWIGAPSNCMWEDLEWSHAHENNDIVHWGVGVAMKQWNLW